MKFLKNVKKVMALGLAFATLNTSFAFADAIVKVTGTNVNVRSAATTESDVISTVDTGLTLSVASLKDGWFKLSNADGSEAYITTEFVKLTQADGIVNSTGVNVRKGPNTAAEVVTQVGKGENLLLLLMLENGTKLKLTIL